MMHPAFWPRHGSGAMRFFCEWPVVEIQLSTVGLYTNEFAAAAERVAPMWPESA